MTISRLSPRILHLLLALTSAAFLLVSFPNFNQPWAAWVAFVPWFVLLRQVSGRGAFWWSYLIGALFFLGSIWWLVYVTVIGWLLLCSYLALYFAAFGWFVRMTARGSPAPALVKGGPGRLEARGKSVSLQPPASSLQQLLVIPATWVALEYARSHVLSGFGWNLLAYSQTPWLPVIQIADITGAWGVSFIVVLANVAIAETIQCCRSTQHLAPSSQQRTTSRHYQLRPCWLLCAGCCVLIAVVLGYGFWRLHHFPLGQPARIAVVQGNIPQEEKWEEALKEKIAARYDTLTREAAATQPDLIVWPETSAPGYFGADEEITQRVTALASALKRPLLIGAPMVRPNLQGLLLYNGAALVSAAGDIVDRYGKLHLVPYGEFLPGERWFSWLRAILPPIGEFVPGTDYTVFHLGSGFRVQGSGQPLGPEPPTLSPEPSFSVLICFEDVFPDLARQFVRRGAQLLVVITNDAWFGPTAAAYQHAQASTFRAVELRVPVVRAANTGWSGCIDSSGSWRGSVRDASGAELFIAGTHTCDITLGASRTVYLQWGDWFAWSCIIASAGCFLLTRRRFANNQQKIC